MRHLGWGALAALVLLVLASVGAVLFRADWPIRLTPADWAAIRFTLWQSVLSASLSLAAAIPLARALARRQFPGRGFLITALGAPFIIPVIVAVFGLLAIWGRSGVVSDILMPLGLGRVDIYGLPGVVLAHVFFNLPLATRLFLQGWAAIPGEHFRLTAQLGTAPIDRFRLLEWPMLRATAPGAFLLIFILCMTSFATVLALGGGPKSTSVELAIYAALRFEFDLGRAAILAIIQMILSGGAALMLLRISRPLDLGSGLDQGTRHWISHGRLSDAAITLIAMLFLFLPMAAILWRGLAALPHILDAKLFAALIFSLKIAAVSTLLAVAAALAIAALAAGRRSSTMIEAPATLVLIVSPFVLGTGLFILINPVADPFALSLWVTAVINAAVSLPFCLRILAPEFARLDRQYGRLSSSLSITGWHRFRLITWPGLRRPLGFSAGLAAAFSMGDLGVITLFANPETASLPLLMQRLMGAYQMEAAAAVALVLVSASFAVFAICDWGGRHGRHL